MRTTLRFALLTIAAAAAAFPGWSQEPAPAPAPAATPAAQPAPKLATAPKLVAVEAVKDVGKVAKSDKVEVVFALRNDGSAPLSITDVRPTCGCTVARFDATIAPGKTGEVHAAVDTADFSGPIAKTLTVLSNDPATPRLTLTIKADVEPQVELRPGFARFNFVQSQEPITIQQTIWAGNFADFKVLDVKSPYRFVTATFHKATAAELRNDAGGNTNQWVLETTIQPDAEVGALRDFLEVKTNHPKQKELRIPITGFVRPILTVTPYVADFGAVELKDTAKDLSIIVTNFGAAPVEITRVTTGVPGVEATVKPIEAGKRFEITIALKPGMAKGAINSTLKIETTSPQKPSLDVPLKGTVS
jgi:hypothetical protein